MTTLTQDCQKLRRLKLAKEKTAAADAAAKKEFDQFKMQLLDRMEREEVDAHRTGGVLFSVTETTFAQVQDRSEFLKWAQDNDEQLYEPREREALINQLVREKLDNGEPLPPGLGFYVRRNVSQRAA